MVGGAALCGQIVVIASQLCSLLFLFLARLILEPSVACWTYTIINTTVFGLQRKSRLFSLTEVATTPNSIKLLEITCQLTEE